MKENINKKIDKKYFSLRKYNIIYLIIVSLFILVLNLTLVNANFVCGEVVNSDENVSASWYNVNIFYENNPKNISVCKVSPAQNRYCCDVESIPGSNWKIGDLIFAEIYNNNSGYVAGPVNVLTTSAAYDIMPMMKLEKVIKTNTPLKKIIISEYNDIIFNISFKSPYNLIELEKNNNNKTLLCSSCSTFNNNISLDFGTNYLRFISSGKERVFYENMKINILKEINSYRNFSCKDCDNGKIKSNEEVLFNLSLELSDSVDNLELKEYVPKDFEILDTFGGEIKEYSSSHKLIVWNVSGKDIIKSYKIKSPDIILPKNYYFKTELEDYYFEAEKINVYKYFSFFSTDKNFENISIEKTKYFSISPSEVLIYKPFNSIIKKIVIFPNKKLDDINLNFYFINHTGIDNEITGFHIFSNIKKEEVSDMLIEFSIDRELLEENNFGNISLFTIENGKLIEQKINFKYSDNNSYYYDSNFMYSENVIIAGIKKQNFFEKIFNL